MLFSVLIPVYNTSKYLDECINSVLSQTEKDFEIVLLNDGSTDNSGDICDSYAEKYPDFIRVIHKENEGLMMTRRRGFKEAKGDYFICLDSDDYLRDNNALLKIKKMIVEKGCDLVVYNYLAEKQLSENNQMIELFDLPDGYVFEGKDKQVLYEKLLIGRDFNAIWIKAPNCDIVDVDVDYSQWKQDICRAEDLFQSFPMLTNAKRVGYIKDMLLHYRWTESSISNNPKLKFYNAFRTIYLREEKYLGKWNLDDAVVHKARLRRIPNIIGIVVGGYKAKKSGSNKKEWLGFIDELSKDDFIKSTFSKKNTEGTLLYYKLLGRLILGNHKFLLQRTIDFQTFVSKIHR